MVDILTIVMDNSQLILLVISIVLALAAKYFSNQAKAFADAAQAVTDLSQEVLNDLRDGTVSPEELKAIVIKADTAQKAIKALIDLLMAPQTVAQKFVSVFTGYKPDALFAAMSKVQNMKMKRK